MIYKRFSVKPGFAWTLPTLAIALLLTLAAQTRAAQLDLATATIPELQAAMLKGSLTSEKLMRLYLARKVSTEDRASTDIPHASSTYRAFLMHRPIPPCATDNTP